MDKFEIDNLRLYKHALMGVTDNVDGIRLSTPVIIGPGISITELDGETDQAELTLEYTEAKCAIYVTSLSDTIIREISNVLERDYKEIINR